MVLCPMCNVEVNSRREKKNHIKEKNHKSMMKHCKDYIFLIPKFLVDEYIETLKFERCN